MNPFLHALIHFLNGKMDKWNEDPSALKFERRYSRSPEAVTVMMQVKNFDPQSLPGELWARAEFYNNPRLKPPNSINGWISDTGACPKLEVVNERKWAIRWKLITPLEKSAEFQDVGPAISIPCAYLASDAEKYPQEKNDPAAATHGSFLTTFQLFSGGKMIIQSFSTASDFNFNFTIRNGRLA